MKVQVAYALPDHQEVLTLDVAQECTLEQALRASGLLERFPDIDLTQQKAGICGHVRPLNTVLQPGDRVEVYRPRAADPKLLRRERARRKSS